MQMSCVNEFLQVMTWYLAIQVIGNEMILGQMASVTLAISPRPVAAAAYLHSGQLQIHSTPSEDQLVEIYSRESGTTAQWGEVRIRQHSGAKLESDSTVGRS